MVAVPACVAGNRLGDIGHAVQQHVEAAGLSVVRSLVGHGIGRDMHEEPQIPNYGQPGTGILLEEGMVMAVEPMVTAGRHAVRVADDHWSIFSQDGSLAAHFEFTIAITANGPRVLTPWHEADAGRAVAWRLRTGTAPGGGRGVGSGPLLTSPGAPAARPFDAAWRLFGVVAATAAVARAGSRIQKNFVREFLRANQREGTTVGQANV